MKVLSISDEDEQRSHLKALPSLWQMPVLNLKNNQKTIGGFHVGEQYAENFVEDALSVMEVWKVVLIKWFPSVYGFGWKN